MSNGLTLEDLGIASAFLVFHEDAPGEVVTVSGPYLTHYVESRRGLYRPGLEINPIHHEEASEDGLRGQDAARVYEEAVSVLLGDHPAVAEYLRSLDGDDEGGDV